MTYSAHHCIYRRAILRIIKNRYIRIFFLIVFAIFLIAIVADTLFIRTPRTDKEVQEFIAQAQINYPLPEETTGWPSKTKDKTGEFVSISPPERLLKRLKISKRDRNFYWDSWKGQKLNVIRGLRYFPGYPVPSTVFISEENDGMILIDNELSRSIFLMQVFFCGDFSTGAMRYEPGSSYLEIRSPMDAEVEIVKGYTGSYYPSGVATEICAGRRTNLLFKPSLYQQIKKYFYKNND